METIKENNVQRITKEWNEQESRLIIEALVDYAYEHACYAEDGIIDEIYGDSEYYLDEVETILLVLDEIFKVKKELAKEFKDKYEQAYGLVEEVNVNLEDVLEDYDGCEYLSYGGVDLEDYEIYDFIKSALEFMIEYEQDANKKKELEILFNKYNELCK